MQAHVQTLVALGQFASSLLFQETLALRFLVRHRVAVVEGPADPGLRDLDHPAGQPAAGVGLDPEHHTLVGGVEADQLSLSPPRGPHRPHPQRAVVTQFHPPAVVADHKPASMLLAEHHPLAHGPLPATHLGALG